MVFVYVFRVGFFRIAFCLLIQDYQTHCPSFPQWKIRGYGFCNNSSIYTCLHNTNEDKFIENCGFGLNLLEPGYRFVISGMLDSRPCGPERFQPFSLLPNTSSRCVTRKSQCNREGQVVYSNGTTTRDRSCRCNYRDNFVFVTKPKTKCYCIPSEEDCSCYSKACDVDHYLTPDYQCVHFSNWTGIFQCPAIQNEKIPKNGATTRKSVPDSTYSTSRKNTYLKYVVSIIVPVIFLCGVCFVLGTYFNLQDEQGIAKNSSS
ncbi:unnamed protein product [Mytilus coruscus]|uniref:Uncharacterized protein n=1 Tax=Mytilus coruscus TaxID=42192 RepID=A0A6J8DE08_MYTCO|nr:unnamed protein product [Mytilus coruscus]